MVADVNNAAAAGLRDATAYNMVLRGRASVSDELQTPVSFSGDTGVEVQPRGAQDLTIKVNPQDLEGWASGQSI